MLVARYTKYVFAYIKWKDNTNLPYTDENIIIMNKAKEMTIC